MEIIKPDYDNSILNLVSSILKYYNVESNYKTLNIVDEYLINDYQNIILLIFDGMGQKILMKNSPNGYFSKNKIGTITTVYPSTTTAAMTAYYSGLSPLESGHIAWSQYFKEYGRAIDVLPCRDSYTGEKFECKAFDINKILEYETIYEKIEEANSDVKVYNILPPECASRWRRQSANNIPAMSNMITSICEGGKRKFIFGYVDNPDSIIHKTGCYSWETKKYIFNIEKVVANIAKKLKGTKTLILISADHGHIDIEKEYDLRELKEIQECLIMPPTLESRMQAFWVKEEMKEEFEKRFKAIFKDEFILYKKSEFLEEGLLGRGKQHYKVDDFLGNYVSVGVSNSRMILGTYISKEHSEKKATHCGLTKEEMLVPVIAIEC